MQYSTGSELLRPELSPSTGTKLCLLYSEGREDWEVMGHLKNVMPKGPLYQCNISDCKAHIIKETCDK